MLRKAFMACKLLSLGQAQINSETQRKLSNMGFRFAGQATQVSSKTGNLHMLVFTYRGTPIYYNHSQLHNCTLQFQKPPCRQHKRPQRCIARMAVGLPIFLLFWGFPKIRVPFWGPHNKDYNSDYNILGSILGSPNLGKLPYDYGYYHSY